VKRDEVYSVENDDGPWIVNDVDRRDGMVVVKVFGFSRDEAFAEQEWKSYNGERYLRVCSDGFTRDFVPIKIGEVER